MTARTGTSFAVAAMAALFVAASPTRAQDAVVSGGTTTVPIDTTAETDGSAPASRIASKYSDFLGSDADSVVQGLRDGEAIQLQEVTPGADPDAPPVVTDVTIDPPTGKMGWGNVDHTLALAEHQLAQAGITEPTPTELQAALEGGTLVHADGTTTDLRGILEMRAEGMGWGQIAHELDTNLGWVKNGKAELGVVPGDGADVSDGVEAGASSTASAEPAGSGRERPGDAAITDAGGATASSGRDRAITDASGNTDRGRGRSITDAAGNGEHRRGQGITDATGSTGNGRGHGITDASGATGHERGRGITDAMGDASGSGRGRAISDAMGSGGATGSHGRGHGITTAMGDASGGSRSIVSGSGAVAGGGHGHGGGNGANAIVSGDGSGGSGHGGGFGGGHGGGHGRGKH